MKITLTEEQKQKLEEQHKTERDISICDRIKAVLLASEGWTQKQIAQPLRIHETTVWCHVKDYLLQKKLKPSSGGSSSKLNEHVRNNTVFDSFAEFKAKIRTFFSSTWNTILPDLPDRINDSFQKQKPVVSI